MRESFEPHRAAWHVLAVLFGLAAFVVPPAGLALLVDPWQVDVWAAGLIGSGLLGIAAPLLQHYALVTALATERAALWVQTGTLVWIIIAVVYYQGPTGWLSAAVYLLWAAANAVRARRIASATTKSEGDGK